MRLAPDIPRGNPAVCPHSAVRLTWYPMRNGHRHIRVTCAGCRKFLKWAAQTPLTTTLADRAAEGSVA